MHDPAGCNTRVAAVARSIGSFLSELTPESRREASRRRGYGDRKPWSGSRPKDGMLGCIYGTSFVLARGTATYQACDWNDASKIGYFGESERQTAVQGEKGRLDCHKLECTINFDRFHRVLVVQPVKTEFCPVLEEKTYREVRGARGGVNEPYRCSSRRPALLPFSGLH